MIQLCRKFPLVALILIGCTSCSINATLRRRIVPSEENRSVHSFWPFTRKSLFPISRRSDFVEDFTVGPPLIRDREELEPLDVGVISGTINNPNDGSVEIETHPQPEFNQQEPVGIIPDTSSLFNHFFGNPFFNTFGFPSLSSRRTPWWKGSNVCTEREESQENKIKATDSVEKKSTNQQTFNFDVHLSLNSCVERSHKHVCTSIVNDQGHKKVVKVTRQCCHGFARKSNAADSYDPCVKIDLKSITETANKLDGKEFIKIAEKNDLNEMLQQNMTVFIPSDKSFGDFTEQMLETNIITLPLMRRRRRYAANNIISNLINKDLILNHIVNDWINIEDIENEQLLQTAYDNLTIRMNIFPPPPNDKSYEYSYRYTANCAPLTKVNQMAENGIIHMIDNVLTPITMNLWEIIQSRNDMTILQTVLEKTNLAKILANADKVLTLFAPNDMAFEKLDSQLKRTIKDGNGCALNILKNHILDMTFCTVAVVDNARTGARNALGLKINFERMAANQKSNASEENASAENANADTDESNKIIRVNGEAIILETDIMGTNGVIHVIDKVLTTESGMPFTSMLEKRNLTIFKRLIEASDIENEIDTIMNATFFIPMDKAFENTKWKKLLDEQPDTLKNNKQLNEMIEYHIGKPLTKTCDLSEKLIETVAGIPLRVNLYSTHSVFNNIINRATANCARLVHFDEDTCGSVLHQIDHVLVPPKKNLLNVLKSNPNYSMFLKLIRDANLTQILQNPKSSLTVLVPNNDIFGELDQFYNELIANRKQLEKFVKLHILDDVLCCAGIVQTEWPFVRLVKTINDYDLKIGRDLRPKIQNTSITKCDIIADNGILLEVNDVINVNKEKPTSFLEF